MFDNFIVEPLAWLFEKLHGVIAGMGISDVGVSYVVAILVFTLAIRLLILPLNIKSTRASQKMQEVQPELQKIQKKYANDPQKAQMEMNRVMKENGASYMGSCLPMLLPLPILFALYYVFRQITGLEGASFLWIPDLMGPDPLYILPILAGLSTYLPSLLMSKATAQNGADSPINMNVMNVFMSGMMVFMSLQFQSILVIYWIFGGAIQLVQTYFLQYAPAQKKKAEKATQEADLALSRAKKATPKTKKK